MVPSQVPKKAKYSEKSKISEYKRHNDKNGIEYQFVTTEICPETSLHPSSSGVSNEVLDNTFLMGTVQDTINNKRSKLPKVYHLK